LAILALDQTQYHIHSVGLPWLWIDSSQSPLPVQNTTFTTEKLPCSRRDSNRQSQQDGVAYLRLRPRGHWGRVLETVRNKVFCVVKLDDCSAKQKACESS